MWHSWSRILLLATLAMTAARGDVRAEEDQPTGVERGAQHVTLTPDGLIQDEAGGLLRFSGRRITLVMVAHRFTWSADKRWVSAGPVGDLERRTLRYAVEQFNKLPGLGLQIDFVETSDPSFTLGKLWPNRDKLVAYWAVETPVMGRPFAYNARLKSYKGGALVVIRDPSGHYFYHNARKPIPAGSVIGGGMLVLRDYASRPDIQGRCKALGPAYALLHELGHTLGLGHRTPAPAVMRGTCSSTYLANDIRNFQRLYGAR